MWEGFLRSPRIYWPLLNAFKAQFLETACHYNDLCEHGRQYAELLTYTALESVYGFDPIDFRRAFEDLPPNGLHEAARTLPHALDCAGEQRENYWNNRILPFWKEIWPKSLDLVSGGIAESLAMMSISAGEKFPDAVELIYHWLQPIDHLYHFVLQLQESGLCTRFPDAALRILDAVICDQHCSLSELRVSELGNCLSDISRTNPDAQNDSRYQRLIRILG